MAADSKILQIIIALKQTGAEVLDKTVRGLGRVNAAGQAYRATIAQMNTAQQSFVGGMLRLAALAGGVDIFRRAAASAISFNSTIEQSRIGIAALVRTFNDFTDAEGRAVDATTAYKESVQIATQIQRQLQIEGLKTTATYEELLRALQEGIGPAFKAGFDPQQIVRFTSLMVQAAAGISLPMDQLGQELRAIMDGTIDRNARIARALGLTNEKVKELAKSGELYDYLVGKLKEFGAAGEETAKTFQGATSNLADAIQMALGRGLDDAFNKTTGLLLRLRDAIVTIDEEAGTFTFNDKIVAALARVDEAIANLIEGAGQNLDTWVGRVADIMANLAIAGIRVAEVILKILDTLGPFLPAIVQTVTYMVILKTAFAVFIGLPLTLANQIKALAVALGILKQGASISGVLAALRAALAGVATQAGIAGVALRATLAGAAAYAAIQIYKLVRAMQEWRKAAKEAKEAEGELLEATAKNKQKYEAFKDIQIPVKLEDQTDADLKVIEENLRKAKAYWSAELRELQVQARATNWFGSPTEEARAAQMEIVGVKRRIEELEAAIKKAGGSKIDMTPKAAPPDPEEVNKIEADQKRLQEQLNADLARLDANKWQVLRNQARLHYEAQLAMAHGQKDLLLQIEQNYAASLKRINEEEARETTEARAQSRVTRSEADLSLELAKLEQLYDQGKVSLQAYFTRRRAIIDEQYTTEIESLKALAVLQKDKNELLAIEDQIYEKEIAYKQALIELTGEQTAAEKRLIESKKDLDNLLADMRLRADQGAVGQGLGATFQTELGEMDRRHADERESFMSLLNDKLGAEMSYYEQRAAIDELYRIQKQEKDQLLADQEQRLMEARLTMAQDVASGMSEIFGTLYDLTGKSVKELFYLQKAAAIAEAMINAHLAASKALAEGGPYMGPIMAGVQYALGMVRVASIVAQKLAFGGPVRPVRKQTAGGRIAGSSPTETADNVPILATAGEYMHPVSAVRYYGVRVMEAIRRKMIPRESLQALIQTISVPLMPGPPAFALAAGGQISPAATFEALAPQDGRGDSREKGMDIVNIIDPQLFDRYMATSSGRRSMLNFISENSFQVRRALEIS
ncbi:hypothetical protein [Desulfatiglans anilini]|uniref:hypothetical protein n=1 Tax=Desulfatiglans anilini TaxID=90728 RepID=UPI00042046CD|nr:hypothetical protein [Desulfatiglans anilini]